MQALIDTFVFAQGWLFDRVVQPILLALGFGSYIEVAFDGVEFFLLGALQISLAYLLLRPLEAWRPIEIWPDRKPVRVDVLYSMLDRLGVIPLGVFALLAQPFMEFESWLRYHDIIPPQVEDWLPGLDARPMLSFFIYLFLIDFAQYWRHRLSHTLRWWWALHAIHHSQTQMTLWTDSRNHLLDDLIGGAWFAVFALLFGVPPGHFVGLIVAAQLVENLSHVNARIHFGRIGEALLVSPGYHRWHHALDLPAGEKYRHGCNFAILFPIWDRLFGTQYRAAAMPPTGIHPDPAYGELSRNGFWQQQRDGLVALLKALQPRRRAADNRI
jgi:sterol desaturase/sphingolipid hydroxylase (fatty acid hydroxylase superfamily)